MPVHIDPIEYLASILSKGDRYAFLLGAGISIAPPASLPSGAQFVSKLLSAISSDTEVLQTLTTFADSERADRELPGTFLRFETLMQTLAEFGDPQLDVLNPLRMQTAPNTNHYAYAQLLRDGHVICTTNFDTLIERACISLGIGHVVVAAFSKAAQDHLPDANGSTRHPTLYKLHGSFARFDETEGKWHAADRTIIAALRSIFRGLDDLPEKFRYLTLTRLLQSHDLIVMGYSGYDDFDVSLALRLIESEKRILWINHISDSRRAGVRTWADLQTSPTDRSGQLLSPRDRLLFDIGSTRLGKRFRRPDDILIIDVNSDEVMRLITNRFGLSSGTLPVPSPKRMSWWASSKSPTDQAFANWQRRFMKDIHTRRLVCARLLTSVREYDKAKVQLNRSLSSFRASDAPIGIVMMLEFARIERLLGNYQQALDILRKVTRFPKGINDLGVKIAHSEIPLMLAHTRGSKECREAAQTALAEIGLSWNQETRQPFFEVSFDKTMIDKIDLPATCFPSIAVGVATSYIDDREFLIAIEWLRAGVRDYAGATDVEEVAYICYSLGAIYHHLGDKRRAIRFAYRADVLSESIGTFGEDQLNLARNLTRTLKEEVGPAQYADYCVAAFSEFSAWDAFRLAND
jgi:tetratricopeptide (TPR) repeat protein